ncbi:MAG: glycoside hydrolase family 97 N-terminal domain-containing protein [Planctomycetes bacterium]|nr:glycoside hydrolase family 97 N-terminal domain-containing protein [Planctomycetota bacterium]
MHHTQPTNRSATRPFASLVIALLLAALLVPVAQAERFTSPDGLVAVSFDVAEVGQEPGVPVYGVSYRGKPILADSRLGFVLKDGPPLVAGFKVVSIARTEHDTTWKPVYGERSEVRDHYHQAVVDLEDAQTPPRRLRLTFRLYNEGAALCYTFPQQPGLDALVIAAENTEFRFTADHTAYPVYSAQGVYSITTLDKVKANCERPLTVEIADGPCVAIGEARLVDYARMRLKPVAGKPYTLQSMLAGEVKVATPYTTPWRVVMIGETPGQLIERNYLIENLNDPCAIADPSWIKPGKVIREVTLTTEGGKACVDFAVARGLQYVEYDAGWYGHEYEGASDATTVTRDTKKSGVQGELDMHEVIRYADEHGIGILVYVNRRQLERQLDEILPLYQEWGIKGVKYGFVNVGSQQWTTWLHDAVRKAAEHRLMVDVHDEYRPTGYSRTYPNLMTQEGIRGNECMPPAEHNLILPFTRGLCGAGDATVCWYTTRIQTTHAHQLACPVIFYSPWQFLHWYDRPSQFQGEPELDFFKHVPAAWDETRVVQGRIGHTITMARRSGRQWYVGTLNARERRTIRIPLDFLEPGVPYDAYIYSDGAPQGDAPFDVKCEQKAVDSTVALEADMAANGGQAIRLVPKLP